MSTRSHQESVSWALSTNSFEGRVKTDCRHRVVQTARSISDVDISNLTAGNVASSYPNPAMKRRSAPQRNAGVRRSSPTWPPLPERQDAGRSSARPSIRLIYPRHSRSWTNLYTMMETRGTPDRQTFAERRVGRRSGCRRPGRAALALSALLGARCAHRVCGVQHAGHVGADALYRGLILLGVGASIRSDELKHPLLGFSEPGPAGRMGRCLG